MRICESPKCVLFIAAVKATARLAWLNLGPGATDSLDTNRNDAAKVRIMDFTDVRDSAGLVRVVCCSMFLLMSLSDSLALRYLVLPERMSQHREDLQLERKGTLEPLAVASGLSVDLISRP